MRLALIVGFVLGWPAVAGAQAPDPLTYTIRYYAAGAQAPVQTQTLAPGQYSCNEPIFDSTIITNPRVVEWDDPNASGRKCHYVETPGGILFALPLGNYEGTITAMNSTGQESPESTRAPFVRGSHAGTPTAFRVIR